ncbi:hypothetical protein PIIN_06449 [Serendipita indica DSM 11827]|uniref:Uncharacterized protein n=1 Tax=Serendipita indica (strain DSM 11827) TaxID=1109443 RepID=G4TMG7_SERID|nr:hypothetical protein PIIN_06449 [Serendipita indica DSM 11827]
MSRVGHSHHHARATATRQCPATREAHLLSSDTTTPKECTGPYNPWTRQRTIVQLRAINAGQFCYLFGCDDVSELLLTVFHPNYIPRPGCVECHLYLHECSEPCPDPRVKPPKIAEEEPYPASVQSILETRQERYSIYDILYKPRSSTGEFRMDDCQRRGELVEISRYSMIY